MLKQYIARFISSIRQSKNYKTKIVLAFLHTILLIIATITLQYSHLSRSDEDAFLKSFSIIKHDILNINNKPLGDSVVFIDVAKDITLTDDFAFGGSDNVSAAKNVITDRVKLAKLFHIINQHPAAYKYVLCDVFFEKPSEQDSALSIEIKKTKRIITSAVLNGDELVKPIFDVNSAFVNYYFYKKKEFTKMLIYNDKLELSLPVKMYEDVTNNKFSKKHGLTYLNNKFSFNTIIPEYYYRPDQNIPIHDDDKLNVVYLWQVLIDPDGFNHFLKNKYIVIGNFEGDTHGTFLGTIPGSMILFDVFLSLKYNPVTVSGSWILLLFVFYFILSFDLIVYQTKTREGITEKIKYDFLKKTFAKYISYLGIFLLIDLISYFVFKTSVNILYLITYLTALEVVIDKWKQVKSGGLKSLKL